MISQGKLRWEFVRSQVGYAQIYIPQYISRWLSSILGSIVVSIPACHAGDRGSIPRRGGLQFCFVILFPI